MYRHSRTKDWWFRNKKERNSNWFRTPIGFKIIDSIDTFIGPEHCYWHNLQTLNSNSLCGNLISISDGRYFIFYTFILLNFLLLSNHWVPELSHSRNWYFWVQILREFSESFILHKHGLPFEFWIMSTLFSGVFDLSESKFFNFAQFLKDRNLIWLLRGVEMR
jgi:hypothetical protein